MTPMESSIALQMTAIQGFSEAAQLETNDTLRGTYDYILLDHLTQRLRDAYSACGLSEKFKATDKLFASKDRFLISKIPGYYQTELKQQYKN